MKYNSKFLSLFLFPVFVLCTVILLLPAMRLPASAAGDFDVRNGVLVSYNGSSANVVIPNNLGITAIGNGAFYVWYDKSTLVSVTIPEGVTSIGDQAFLDCIKLTTVKLPSTLRTIGEYAFSRGPITSINFPNGLEAIGDYAFSTGLNIANPTFPASLKTIGEWAFRNTPITGTVSLPGVTVIGAHAFQGCTGITGVYTPVVEKIGYSAFFEVTVKTFAIPGTLTMEDGSGIGSIDYTETLIICEGVTEIDSRIRPHSSEETVSTVILPSTLKTINAGALSNLDNVKTLLLPDGLTTFRGLPSGITRLRIPATVVLPAGTSLSDNVEALAFENGYAGEITHYIMPSESIYVPASFTAMNTDTSYGLARGRSGLTIYTPEGSPMDMYPKEYPYNGTYTGTFVYADSPSEDIFGPAYVKTSASDYPPPPAGVDTPPASDTAPPSSWAVAQVNAAMAENLVPRSLQSKYTQAITRAEFCALAVALYENVVGEIKGRKHFTDTQDVNVQKCASIGVASGTDTAQTLFDPDARLTREQAASMLSRLAFVAGKSLATSSATFSDNGSISSWAVGAVGQVQAAGIMGSTSSTAMTFDPKGAYTREQSISTIKRLFDMVK